LRYKRQFDMVMHIDHSLAMVTLEWLVYMDDHIVVQCYIICKIDVVEYYFVTTSLNTV